MILQNLYLHILYCKYRTTYSVDNSTRSLVKKQNHHELVFIANGGGVITVNNKQYPIRDGTILYICPDVSHSIELRAGNEASIAAVHFDCVSVGHIDGKWVAELGLMQLPMATVLQPTDYRPIAELFKKLVDSWEGKLPGYEFVARTYLHELLLAVNADAHKENKNYAGKVKIERIIRYMHENIHRNITLAELSELVQLSPAYLTRSFKDATGYAVIAYFNKIKIDRAKELLIEGDGRVKEVSLALGFSDEFYFSRVFKRVAGTSPTEYRSRNVHGD